MAKKCEQTLELNARYISTMQDDDILRGIRTHADPSWWQEGYVKRTNQAYLKRWGALLRREARKRGLL